jgi:hypothetical protein
VSGGAGVALTALGAGLGIFGRHCRPEVIAPGNPGCGAFVADDTFGPLLAMHGVPLIAVAATYVIRRWIDTQDIAMSFDGRELVLAGRF